MPQGLLEFVGMDPPPNVVAGLGGLDEFGPSATGTAWALSGEHAMTTATVWELLQLLALAVLNSIVVLFLLWMGRR